MGTRLDLALAILNGTIGDLLARTGNGLATPMECIHDGLPLAMDRAALARAHPGATSKLVVLVHGLMCTEAIWAFPDGGDYGAMLARDAGLTPFYVRYNSGLAIADNGAALAGLLDALVDACPVPVEEIVLLGYSMGGLVVRSACHAASLGGSRWLPRVRRAIYVGTPHLGAPMERLGRLATRVLRGVDDPYTRLIADIAGLRSEALQDLGDADLRHEDRARRPEGLALGDRRHPVPLLPGMQHHLVAGALSDAPWVGALFGDAVVPLRSATAGTGTAVESAALPASHVIIVRGVSHMALAHHPEVYAALRGWCTEGP